MPLAGLVLNRVHTSGAQSLSAARALAGAETLDEPGEHPLAAGAAAAARRADADASSGSSRLRGRFTAAHPRVPVVDVPAQPGDVHDLAGLREIGAALAGS